MKLTLEYPEEGVAVWKNSKGETVTRWSNSAIMDYPEDLTADRDIGSLVEEVYEKGFQDAKKESTRLREAFKAYMDKHCRCCRKGNFEIDRDLDATAALEGK